MNKTGILIVFILVLMVFFSGCSGLYGTGQPDIDENKLEIMIHNLINQKRSEYSLSALEFDYDLCEIARLHSEDMAENDYFSHVNLLGQDPTSRANAFGYDCYKDFGGYYSDGIGENIFQNNLYTETGEGIFFVIPYWYTEWSTMDEIAESTVNGWMNSVGHRQNILDESYDREGIGVAISSDDKVYITEDFW